MSTNTNTKKLCSKCNKGGATFTCDGCQRTFCLKHVSDHRQELSQQMDNIGQQYDILKQDIIQQSINKTLLAQIDRWETESITKIQIIADKARANLKRLTDESKNQLTSMMSKLSSELRSNRESDDYTESDLDRWIKQIEELREKLEDISNFEIVNDTSSPFHSIKIVESNVIKNVMIDFLPTSASRSVERFKEVSGPAILFKDGFSVVSMGTPNVDAETKDSSSSGVVLYSSGIHSLRFRIATSSNSAVFFGIITSSEAIVNKTSACRSAHGCWSDGGSVRKGLSAEIFQKIETIENDNVTITLDCSKQRFTYFHERTKEHVTIAVDEFSCPLPWKLVVTLWSTGDQIEILNF